MRVFQLPYLLSKYDLVLGPLYFVLIVVLVLYIKTKFYKDSPLRQYLLPGLVVLLIGNVLQGVIHNFLYPSSDIQNYYSGAAEIWNATKENPKYGLELIFKPVADCSAKAQEFANHMAFEYFAPSTRFMFQISGFIGMFCFGAYMPISLIFTCFGYIGLWRIFKCFSEDFPKQIRFVFIACMLIPSVIMWCGNIQKEPLCMFGLGLCVEALHALVKSRFRYWHSLTLALGAIILLSLKNYIFFSFLMAALPTLYASFLLSSIKKVHKKISKIALLLAFFCLCGWIFTHNEAVNNMLDSFFINNVDAVQNSQMMVGGSTYIIPNVRNFSLGGLISTYLLSLNVALFRPYVWEAKNLLMLLNSLEVLAVLLLTIYLLVRTRIVGFFKAAGKEPMLIFCLSYTFAMAPMAGLIAFNFGTLMRYKLPFVPFFDTYLLLLYAGFISKNKELNG
jgi:hypothetical protein